MVLIPTLWAALLCLRSWFRATSAVVPSFMTGPNTLVAPLLQFGLRWAAQVLVARQATRSALRKRAALRLTTPPTPTTARSSLLLESREKTLTHFRYRQQKRRRSKITFPCPWEGSCQLAIFQPGDSPLGHDVYWGTASSRDRVADHLPSTCE